MWSFIPQGELDAVLRLGRREAEDAGYEGHDLRALTRPNSGFLDLKPGSEATQVAVLAKARVGPGLREPRTLGLQALSQALRGVYEDSEAKSDGTVEWFMQYTSKEDV